MLFYTIIGAEH